jgi:uncharacterized protein
VKGFGLGLKTLIYQYFRMMMMQMGMTPSQKKINQMMKMMNNQLK